MWRAAARTCCARGNAAAAVAAVGKQRQTEPGEPLASSRARDTTSGDGRGGWVMGHMWRFRILTGGGHLRCDGWGFELGELRDARCQLLPSRRFRVEPGSAAPAACDRAAAREVTSVVVTAAVDEQVVRRAPGRVFSLVGGGRSCRRVSSLHAAVVPVGGSLCCTSLRVCCDAPSLSARQSGALAAPRASSRLTKEGGGRWRRLWWRWWWRWWQQQGG